MDFNGNLRIRYSSLTNQGKRVADFIMADPSKAIHMTAKALGDESGTSAASVIRFCNKLGYESLEALKIHLARSLNSEEMSMPLETIVSSESSIHDLGPVLFGNTSKALQETLELLDYDDLKKAIELLKKAKTIYIFGVGASSLTAIDLIHKFNRIGKPCIYLMDGHTNLEFASVTTKKDVVIALSYSGETKEVYLAAQGAMNNGVPVISITRNRPSTLSALSTIVFRLSESEKRIRAGAFSSKFSQMFMADLLYLGLIHEDYNIYENLLVDTSRIVRGLRE